MQSIISFWEWFLEEMPAFLMSEPIVYFVGLILLGYCIKLIVSLRKG